MPTSKSTSPKVGITLGDPSGIGPAIILNALSKLKGRAKFLVIGDSWVFSKIQNFCLPAGEAGKIQNFNFLDLHNVSRKNFSFGKVKAEYGRASIEYLNKALELIKKKEIDCLVTCPISKEAINLAGYPWPGHTEYLAEHTRCKDFAMMLLNKQLKISLVTRHLALREVPLKLKKEDIYKTILLTDIALKQLFLIRNPRIVVCGLNPHASDNGLLGNEENRIIKPAIKHLMRSKVFVDGPLPSDVAIFKASINRYDCVIALYHDQALIPLKMQDASTGVNLTLGLPFVRTSPLHGTAFDIAGQPRLADPSSLIAAIQLAIKCTLNLKKA